MIEAPGASADNRQEQADISAAASRAAAQPASPPTTRAEFLHRAVTGDTSVLPQLQQHLDANPSIWGELGDLGASATNAWITLIAGANLIVRESLTRKVAAMQAELASEDATTMERLLAQRIAAEWLQLQYADMMIAQAAGHGAKIFEFWTRRQAETQRRYLAAIKALSDAARLRPRTATKRGVAASPTAEHSDEAGVSHPTTETGTVSERASKPPSTAHLQVVGAEDGCSESKPGAA